MFLGCDRLEDAGLCHREAQGQQAQPHHTTEDVGAAPGEVLVDKGCGDGASNARCDDDGRSISPDILRQKFCNQRNPAADFPGETNAGEKAQRRILVDGRQDGIDTGSELANKAVEDVADRIKED